MSKNLNALIEAAIFAALAMVLSFIPDFANWFSPSFGAIPLVLFALRRGTKYGLLAGLIWGLMHFILGKVYYLSLSQVLIEYILAFISMGLAGLLSANLQTAIRAHKTKKAWFIGLLASFLAVGVRYLQWRVYAFLGIKKPACTVSSSERLRVTRINVDRPAMPLTVKEFQTADTPLGA